MNDDFLNIQQQVEQAVAAKASLWIRGGGSKDFLGNAMPEGCRVLDVSGHSGVVEYYPEELVVTVRAGTRLDDLRATLAESGQMLAFEPPAYGDATIGGTIACNLSGPARPYYGAARDFLLGVKMLNGKAEELNLGGQVMKNVAGYDASRLMAGAMGCLGVLLEVSLKVLPMTETTRTLVRAMASEDALAYMNELAGRCLPITGMCVVGGQLFIRLAGYQSAVEAATQVIEADVLLGQETFWEDLREHKLNFFDDKNELWRCSVPQKNIPLALAGETIIDWGGALYWIYPEESIADNIRQKTRASGGHASPYHQRSSKMADVLSSSLCVIHRNLKQSFDPSGLFNPNRLYEDL